MEQHQTERYIYQGDGGSSFDKLTVLGNNSASNLLGITNSTRISEITDEEASSFEQQGVEIVRSSFQESQENIARKRSFEARRQELKRREEELCAKQQKL